LISTRKQGGQGRTDVTESVKLVHLPPNERVVVRVDGGGDERTPPVDPRSESVEVALSDGREVAKPVIRLGELLDLLTGNAYEEEG
jgi:hypothetical protein